jgi:protein-L-isoaspartate(D-aspartate) O-methyltransferase
MINHFSNERAELVLLLREKGIHDTLVLDAINKVERHLFIEEPFKRRAYEDSALPIGHEQTISQPYTVAFMTQELSIKPGSKILEVGTGSGYQSVILATMGCRVFTIERHIDLLERARAMFEHFGFHIASKAGDGTIGWPQYAPYDGILVTAGAPMVPKPLKDQLLDGGKIVVPVGDREYQKLVVMKRAGQQFVTREIDGFKFVPLVGKEGWGGTDGKT